MQEELSVVYASSTVCVPRLIVVVYCTFDYPGSNSRKVAYLMKIPVSVLNSDSMQQQHIMRAEHASTSEVRCWLDEAKQEGRADTAGRGGPIAAALQRLSDEGREERAQAAEVAGDYTPHQLQALLCSALPCPACPGHVGIHMHAHVFVAVGMLHHHESCTNTITDQAHMPSQVRQTHHHGTCGHPITCPAHTVLAIMHTHTYTPSCVVHLHQHCCTDSTMPE